MFFIWRLCLYKTHTINFQTINFQAINFQAINFHTINFQTVNFQTVNFQAINFQAIRDEHMITSLIGAAERKQNIYFLIIQQLYFQGPAKVPLNETANFMTKHAKEPVLPESKLSIFLICKKYLLFTLWILNQDDIVMKCNGGIYYL